MGITAELAQFTAGIRSDRLPSEVETRTRFLVLDLVGNIVRARHDACASACRSRADRAPGGDHPTVTAPIDLGQQLRQCRVVAGISRSPPRTQTQLAYPDYFRSTSPKEPILGR